jgi:predicted ester cyclase
MRTPEQTKQISRSFIDRVFNQRDLAYADSMLADEFLEHNPLDPSMGNDRKAALASFEGVLAMSPDIKAEIIDLVAAGDRVAIRSRYSGTDSGIGWGSPMGIPATGKPFSIEGIDVAVLDEEGKFREHYGLFDVYAMMTQLGLTPPPAAAPA